LDQLVYLIQRQSFFPTTVRFDCRPPKFREHRFVRKMGLKDALLPREIVALTTLPQSGFVQQPLIGMAATVWPSSKPETSSPI
jgi:hypothetical protein